MNIWICHVQSLEIRTSERLVWTRPKSGAIQTLRNGRLFLPVGVIALQLLKLKMQLEQQKHPDLQHVPKAKCMKIQ